MYFEPTKKTYYRFPSSSSANDFDAKYYYPDQPKAFSEDTQFETRLTNNTNSIGTHYMN